MQKKVASKDLVKFNLTQLLNMLDDQQQRIEKLHRLKHNRQFIEMLQSLLVETRSDSPPDKTTAKSQDHRLRFAIEKLVSQFVS